jgi:sulfur carrier protein ThiS
LFKALSGVDQDRVDVVEGITIDQLCQTLGQRYKKLPFDNEHTFFVVNDKVAKRDQILQENDEVRIFQLIAGG